ncbi:hypothetical protein IOCL2690_000266500 [Leishmania lindenbergi]|uniref:Uncharacterized protein n=1 Tax=Leishmania lindenbergi TaxID=651832 RepID=A0AAW3AP02_9TRYP
MARQLNALTSALTDKMNRQFKGSEGKHAAKPIHATAAVVITPERYGNRSRVAEVEAAAEVGSAEAALRSRKENP